MICWYRSSLTMPEIVVTVKSASKSNILKRSWALKEFVMRIVGATEGCFLFLLSTIDSGRGTNTG